MIKIEKIIITLIIFGIFFLSGFFNFVRAGTPLSENLSRDLRLQTSALNSNEIFGQQSMTDIIAVIIKTFLSLLGIIFTVLMLYGGYMWMTAQGDESKVEKAKSTIQSAVIGLIIVVSTYSITYTIFRAL